MKHLKMILTSVLILSLLFSGCTKKDKEKDSSSSSSEISSSLVSITEGSSSRESSDNSSEESSSEGKDTSGESSGESTQETFNVDDKNAQINNTSSGSGIVYENGTSNIPNINTGGKEYSTLSSEQIVWGPGSELDENGRPVAPVNLQEKYKEYGAYFIAPVGKNIYLTFDEGYENGYTASILDTLKEKKVSAVFFITMDYATKNHDLIKRMVDEGHIVANHTNHHPNMTNISDAECAEEIMSLHNYVKENFNYNMWLFRAPEGAFSERSLAVTHDQKYLSIFWSFAYKDWDVNSQLDDYTALQKMTSQLHDGAIYLLHAVSSTNDSVLGQFIDTARSEGYIFSEFNLPDPSSK